MGYQKLKLRNFMFEEFSVELKASHGAFKTTYMTFLIKFFFFIVLNRIRIGSRLSYSLDPDLDSAKFPDPGHFKIAT
jgi:hypothetical protein